MLATLLQAIREGDRNAFDSALQPERAWLVARAHHHIDSTLRRFVDADDVVQDVMLIAYRRLATMRLAQHSSLRNWLEQVLVRRVLDERRRHLRLRRRDIETRSLEEALGSASTGTTLHLGSCVPGEGQSPSGAAVTGESNDRLRRVLDRLSDDHRTVIQLLRIDGFTVAETAQRMQRTPQAIYKLLARALTALSDVLTGQDQRTGAEGSV